MTKECLLWEQARELAKERGLEMDEKCPLDKLCEVGCLALKQGLNPLEAEKRFLIMKSRAKGGEKK